MRVFVAGATGAVGRPLVRRLLEGGHVVSAMTRSPERATALRGQGVKAVIADALDADATTSAIVAARPEVVVHQLTDLPARIHQRHYGRSMASTNRLRRETGPTFARAARAAGARRLVVQSVSFMTRNEGPAVLDESAPLATAAPGAAGESVRSLAALEEAVLRAESLEGVVLRYGFFYGPGTAYGPSGSFAHDARRRRLPIVGGGGGLTSFIHVEDAAAAAVLALDRGAPGIYNVTDDDPIAQRDWARLLAQAVGGPPPRNVPLWLARLVAGPIAARATEGRGASNAKARRELGFVPLFPSVRQGFPATFAAASGDRAPERAGEEAARGLGRSRLLGLRRLLALDLGRSGGVRGGGVRVRRGRGLGVLVRAVLLVVLVELAGEDRLRRAEHHGHVAAVEVGTLLDLGEVLELLGEALEDHLPALGVRDLATTEHDRDLDLVAALEEALDVALLRLVVADGDLRTELDLADRYLLLVLARRLLLLGLLVLVLRVVQDSGHGRTGLRRDLDEVEIPLLRVAQSLIGAHDTDLLSVFPDHSHFRHADALVDPGRVPLGRAPVKSSGDRH
jgi:nucleoside-diphosphate-sugar epimerase